jgi:ribosomal protein S18 acetylase RimI-like enzyme
MTSLLGPDRGLHPDLSQSQSDVDGAVMPPAVRLFQRADRDAVLALWTDSGISRPWLDLGREIDAMMAHDRSFFLVAADGDTLVGAVMGGYDGRRGWVYHFAVSPDRRGAGIGRLLMRDLERRMRARGVAKINLQVRGDNREVVDFYARLGYADEHLVSMGKRLEVE